MKKNNNYSVTNEIKNFVMNTTKFFSTPINNIVGYNHLMKEGVLKKPIETDKAYYLLLSDLNIICMDLNKYLKIDISENRLCALISYFHSKHIQPNPINLSEVNSGQFKLAGERLFLDKREPRETRALRSLELKLWNDVDINASVIPLSDSVA